MKKAYIAVIFACLITVILLQAKQARALNTQLKILHEMSEVMLFNAANKNRY